MLASQKGSFNHRTLSLLLRALFLVAYLALLLFAYLSLTGRVTRIQYNGTNYPGADATFNSFLIIVLGLIQYLAIPFLAFFFKPKLRGGKFVLGVLWIIYAISVLIFIVSHLSTGGHPSAGAILMFLEAEAYVWILPVILVLIIAGFLLGEGAGFVVTSLLFLTATSLTTFSIFLDSQDMNHPFSGVISYLARYEKRLAIGCPDFQELQEDITLLDKCPGYSNEKSDTYRSSYIREEKFLSMVRYLLADIPKTVDEEMRVEAVSNLESYYHDASRQEALKGELANDIVGTVCNLIQDSSREVRETALEILKFYDPLPSQFSSCQSHIMSWKHEEPLRKIGDPTLENICKTAGLLDDGSVESDTYEIAQSKIRDRLDEVLSNERYMDCGFSLVHILAWSRNFAGDVVSTMASPTALRSACHKLKKLDPRIFDQHSSLSIESEDEFDSVNTEAVEGALDLLTGGLSTAIESNLDPECMKAFVKGLGVHSDTHRWLGRGGIVASVFHGMSSSARVRYSESINLFLPLVEEMAQQRMVLSNVQRQAMEDFLANAH